MRKLGLGLCLWLGVAAGVAAQPSSDKRAIGEFLAHTNVQCGGSDDARWLEGRFHAWAKSGASMGELKASAAKTFGMTDDVADALVPQVLQRGASQDDDQVLPGPVDRFIAVARTHPASQVALDEAARTISAPYGDCNIGAFERLLEGRPHADAEPTKLTTKMRDREGADPPSRLSNVTANQIAEGQRIAPVVCVQNHYNLAHRTDDALIDAMAGQGIAYVPFFPLGDFSPLQSQTLSDVAERLGATPMQVALAWLLARPPNVLLIPGTSSLAHLRENLAAASIELDARVLARLDRIGRR